MVDVMMMISMVPNPNGHGVIKICNHCMLSHG